MSFEEDFKRRLRVVVGAPDDVDIYIKQTWNEGYAYSSVTYEDGYSSIDVEWGTHSREFLDMGELIRQLDAVPDLAPF